MRIRNYLTGLFLLGSSFCVAQNTLKNTVEGSVLLPFFPGNELLLKYSREVWNTNKLKGELVTGIHLHINTGRDGGIYNDYQLVLGYRQFFWKNLNLEAALQPKVYYRFTDSPHSNRVHDGFGLFTYAMAGYRFEPIRRNTYALFLNVQPLGVAYGFYHSDNWPKDSAGNTDDDIIYFGNLAIGVKF